MLKFNNSLFVLSAAGISRILRNLNTIGISIPILKKGESVNGNQLEKHP